MKKVIFFLFLFSASVALFPSASVNAKENAMQIIHKSVLNEDGLIYVRVVLDGSTFVFVYLSDGITLINVYEEED